MVMRLCSFCNVASKTIGLIVYCCAASTMIFDGIVPLIGFLSPEFFDAKNVCILASDTEVSVNSALLIRLVKSTAPAVVFAVPAGVVGDMELLFVGVGVATTGVGVVTVLGVGVAVRCVPAFSRYYW